MATKVNEPDGSKNSKAEPADFSGTYKLREFMAQPGPITLHSVYNRVGLQVALAPRLEVRRATLHLRFTNSTALLPSRSQLQVLLNDAVVAQLSLNPHEPEVVADIALPVALFKYGYNTLAFAAAQHYTNGCEDPVAPELWTQIDTEQSTLTVEGRSMAFRPTLAELDDLLGPGIGAQREFLFLSPKAVPEDSELRWGAILAEAIGLRLHYVPAVIRALAAKPAPAGAADTAAPALDESQVAGHDAVLFGTLDELKDFLPETLKKEITDAFVGIYPLVSDPAHFLFLVSGRTPSEVTRAATALAVMNSPVSDAPSALIHRLVPRTDVFFFPNNFIEPEKTYRLSDLGFKTRTVQGSAPVRFNLDFTLPPDLYEPESANVVLLLDFAYGANLRADSAVSIYINGEFNQAIRLDDQNGAVLRNYRIYVPLRDFRPGANRLTFEVVMVPLITSVGVKCEQQQVNNLLFTLFDSSRLIMPPADHYAVQPDLNLFVNTGFPYDSSLAVRVVSKDLNTVGAAWTVLARLAQINDRALLSADVAFGEKPTSRHVIIVGALPDIKPDLLKEAPITFGPAVGLPHFSRDQRGRRFESGSLEQMLKLLYRRALRRPKRLSDGAAKEVVGRLTLGRAGLVEAYESPWARAHTMTVVAAGRPEALFRAVRWLVRPEIWYQLGGSVSIWEPGKKTVFSATAGTTFHVGKVSLTNFARYYLSSHPRYWIGFLLGTAFLLAVAVRIWVVRRRRRNFPGASDAEL